MTSNTPTIPSLYDRWTRLSDDQDAVKADLAELFKEGKEHGFNPKAMRAAFSIKRDDRVARVVDDRAEVDLYLEALGVAPARVEENPTDRRQQDQVSSP